MGIAPVTERAAQDIKNLTGADVSGAVHDIQYDNVVHINKRHGKSGKADRSMANAEDIARAGYVLSNYDFAEPGKSNSKYLKSLSSKMCAASLIEFVIVSQTLRFREREKKTL